MNRTLALLGFLTFLLFTFGCNRKEVNEGDNFTGIDEFVIYETDSLQQLNITQVDDNKGEMFLGIEAPDEVKPFVTPPYVVQEVISGDINNDQLSDYIVLLVNPTDDYVETPDALVPVLFLVRQQDNSLKLHLRHQNLIYLEELRSALTYATIELDSTGTGFRITYHTQGGTASGMYEDIVAHFLYNKNKHDWYLQTLSYYAGPNSISWQLEDEARREGDTVLLQKLQSGEYFDEADTVEVNSEDGPYQVKTSKQFGTISLTKFKNSSGILDE